MDKNKKTEKLMEVHEVSQLSGVSIRTLQYYDKIDLLKPCCYTESGYRLYDEAALERLQQIMLFKELEFPLKEIKQIMDAPDFDKNKALEQQIQLLTLKREHLDNLINFARGIKWIGTKTIDFSVFDTKQLDAYAEQVKNQWGKTPEYREFEEKSKSWTENDQQRIYQEFQVIFAEFGQMTAWKPSDERVQRQVKKLQEYISMHFYHCSNEVLLCLGKMYAGGGEFTENIDRIGGIGTAEFSAKAIEIYCAG